MTVSKRTRTWTTHDDETDSTGHSENENSVHDSKAHDKMHTVHEAQAEMDLQAKLLDAQAHEMGMKSQRRFFAKARCLFPLGIVLGVLLGFILVRPYDILEMQAQIALLMEAYDISLKIPEIDLSGVELEWQRLRGNIPELWKLNNDGREFQVGEAMKARGLTAQYPVVLVPGIVSTGLESWTTSPEYRAFFREKLWGGFGMISQVTFNREKWMAAMMLDPDTGLDPPGIKIRAVEGMSAASSFMRGYWIWAKIIENLAVVNYDTDNLYLAPYDWRLSMWNLEERDGYFSRLKATIEGFKQETAEEEGCDSCSLYGQYSYAGKGDIVAVLSITNLICHHSTCYFKWVESPEHGGGGADWVESHIEAFISIAGTHLGVVKAMAAFLSGEMKDTVQMNPAGAYGTFAGVLERFFSRKERRRLFWSWAGSASMWVKGGTAVWGNGSWAPDDEAVLNVQGDSHNEYLPPFMNMTASDAGTWILQRTPASFQKMMATNYSFGIERNEEILRKNDFDHRKWTNPLESRLPNAPTTRFICVYGQGKETERSYWYAHGPHEHDESFVEARDAITYPESSSDVRNGVKMGDGDGTVSLLSLGAMCVEGWKRKRYNPGGINVTTVELPHRPTSNIPRGGANTSDHVDILGSTGLNELILKVATGAGHEVQDNIVSNIREYAKRVQWD
ncbi:hypothetical protein ID866_5925 [Astraeus odoratus]|nr:hypothetical protein ID866_5925 [Astraeus odoratus]